jgi:hypothetical protein
MGGTLRRGARGALDAFLRARFPGRAGDLLGDSGSRGNTRSVRVRDPRELADVDVGVVRAAFGVAETGSVWLSERELGVNAIASCRSTSSSCSTRERSSPTCTMRTAHRAFATRATPCS